MVALGASLQLTATAQYSDGSDVDVSAQAAWVSSDPTRATVGGTGIVTPVAAGGTTMTATYEGSEGSTVVTVGAATRTGVAITPAGVSLFPGDTQQMVATATYSDTTQLDVTTTVTWSSDDVNTALVSNAAGEEGRVTAVGPGTVLISATLGNETVQTSLTVDVIPVTSLAASPTSVSAAVGETVSITLTATYADSSMVDVTDQASFSSSADAVATVAAGAITGVSVGSATVTGSFGGSDANIAVTVEGKLLNSIDVTPATPSIPDGRAVQLSATGNYSDASTGDLTATSTWESLDTGVVTVDSGGLVTSVAPGSATVRATNGSTEGSTTVTVGPPVVVQIDSSNKHSLAVLSNGRVMGWGNNRYGATGIAPPGKTPVTCAVGGTDCVGAGEVCLRVATMDNFGSCNVACTTTCAGADEVCEGGYCHHTVSTPVLVPNLDDVVEVAAGGFSSFARKADGTVVGWGLNAGGYYLGDNDAAGLSVTTTPKGVKRADGSPLIAKQISAGYRHALARDDNDVVFSWGRGLLGQIGDGIDASSRFATVSSLLPPADPPGQPRIPLVASDISAGAFHSLAINRDTSIIYGWGWNSNGQLGDPQVTANSSNPVSVDASATGGACCAGAAKVSAGWAHSLALVPGATSELLVIGWGANSSGEVSANVTGDQALPVGVVDGVREFAAGYGFSMALGADNQVYTWGSDQFSKLGGADLGAMTPVTGLPAGTTSIDAGGDHAFALLPDDRLFIWGSNRFGELGTGDFTQQNTAIAHPTLAP
jgi:alpha-tubulin suppressor-like RCC1 family protein